MELIRANRCTDGGHNVLVKSFQGDGVESWNDSRSKTKGAIYLYPKTMELSMKIHRGCDPNVSDILNFIVQDKDVKFLIRQYYAKGRVERFSIRQSEGMSGREDYYINFCEEEVGLVTHGKHLLHISCFGKIEEIHRMYIGDFAELIYTLNNHGYNIGIHGETSFRYTKPRWIDPEGTTEVHKIDL